MTRDEAIDLALGRYERELEKSGVGYTSLYAFLASLAASGYAVVPVEATEEMAAAVVGPSLTKRFAVKAIYAAMLAAAQKEQG